MAETLPVLDINQIPVFNELITYTDKRDSLSLKRNLLISSIPKKDRKKVINSLAVPPKEVLNIREKILSGNSYELEKHLLDLSQMIIKKTSLSRLVLIAVLRSGFPLAAILRYLIFQQKGFEVPILGLSPNYIDNIHDELFKSYLKSHSNTEYYFVDGWMSKGITYSIIKKFWRKFSKNKSLHFVVVSNISGIKNNDIISSCNHDLFLPWNIALTDTVGLSQYFQHPNSKISTSFYIPTANRAFKNFESIIRKRLNDAAGAAYMCHYNYCKSQDVLAFLTGKEFTNNNWKIGINECIKAIEKGSVDVIYANPDSPYYKILAEYADIFHVRLNPVKRLCFNDPNCLVVRSKIIITKFYN
ncbi:MAG: cysteine protease StiP domain-containing protein [Patescibacteria group bacterium]